MYDLKNLIVLLLKCLMIYKLILWLKTDIFYKDLVNNLEKLNTLPIKKQTNTSS